MTVKARVRFLIVGTPRSGTTLVQRLACELEGVKVPHETHVLSVFPLRLGRRDAFPLSGEALRNGLRRYVALPQLEAPRPDPERLYDALKGRAESILDLLDVVVGATAVTGGTLYGEKTPGHLQWARLVAAAREDLKLICVVRDPRAVALSQSETPWGASDPARSAMRWVIDQHEVRHLQRTFKDRVLALRYEDIVASPGDARMHLGEFLGVEDTGSTPTADTLYRPGETWKSLSGGEISDSRAQRWRGGMTPAARAMVEAVANGEMAHWGYPTERRLVDGWTPKVLHSGLDYLTRRKWQDLRVRRVLSRRCRLVGMRHSRSLWP